MMKTLTGKIKLIEQEGGYAAPIIEIADKYLDNILLKFPHKVITEGADMFDTVLEGEYKITIERLVRG